MSTVTLTSTTTFTASVENDLPNATILVEATPAAGGTAITLLSETAAAVGAVNGSPVTVPSGSYNWTATISASETITGTATA